MAGGERGAVSGGVDVHACEACLHYCFSQGGVVDYLGFEVFDREVSSYWVGISAITVVEVFQRGSLGLGECDCAFECVAESFC